MKSSKFNAASSKNVKSRAYLESIVEIDTSIFSITLQRGVVISLDIRPKALQPARKKGSFKSFDTEFNSPFVVLVFFPRICAPDQPRRKHVQHW